MTEFLRETVTVKLSFPQCDFPFFRENVRDITYLNYVCIVKIPFGGEGGGIKNTISILGGIEIRY